MSILRVGLTGSIGSGKTTVAERLRTLGACVLDADQAAKRLLGQRGEAADAVVKRFGTDILQGDGTIDRKALAEIVFSDERARTDLNAIMHPAVFESLEQDYSIIRRMGVSDPVFFDVPLLFETGYDKKMDCSIVVYADPETILRRTMLRDGASKEQVMKRLSAQMDQMEKIIRADYVIRNDCTIEELYEKVDSVYGSIMNDA